MLESVDTNSSLPTLVLKTDTISIIVPPYDRSMAIQNSITLVEGSIKTLSVENVSSTISNLCSSLINLRQSIASSLPFVTIENGLSFAKVSIDTTAAAVGTYTLALESFDSSAGSLRTTLKRDIANIYVTEFIRSEEAESSITIMKGKQQSFSVEHV